jgi:hypothetical protein
MASSSRPVRPARSAPTYSAPRARWDLRAWSASTAVAPIEAAHASTVARPCHASVGESQKSRLVGNEAGRRSGSVAVMTERPQKITFGAGKREPNPANKLGPLQSRSCSARIVMYDPRTCPLVRSSNRLGAKLVPQRDPAGRRSAIPLAKNKEVTVPWTRSKQGPSAR